jgi:hypothetical protein
MLAASPTPRTRDEVVQPLVAFPMEVVNSSSIIISLLIPSPLVTRKTGSLALNQTDHAASQLHVPEGCHVDLVVSNK